MTYKLKGCGLGEGEPTAHPQSQRVARLLLPRIRWQIWRTELGTAARWISMSPTRGANKPHNQIPRTDQKQNGMKVHFMTPIPMFSWSYD
jgi:hypothetical protein